MCHRNLNPQMNSCPTQLFSLTYMYLYLPMYLHCTFLKMLTIAYHVALNLFYALTDENFFLLFTYNTTRGTFISVAHIYFVVTCVYG